MSEVALLAAMLRIRRFEQTLMAAPDPGFQLLSSGEEAVAVGTCAALSPEDKVTSTHRAHGHTIAHAIEASSGEVLQVEHGSLYPALHRMELRGLLKAKWGASDNNRRAKFYAITAAGRRQLADQTANWERLAAVIEARLVEARA